MPLALQSSAATGGLSAALVSTFLRSFESSAPPVLCQDLTLPPGDWHWPSLLTGILVGLFLGQLLEAVILARHFLSLQVRQRTFALTNAWNVRLRGG